MDKNNIKVILATDCGSTTTKAILIEYLNNEYRLTFRGEAPTTVEAPFEDVTRGVLNSIIELEELSGRQILDNEKPSLIIVLGVIIIASNIGLMFVHESQPTERSLAQKQTDLY